MCGIAGVALASRERVTESLLRAMGGAIQHRGPDGAGLYLGGHVGLAHVRLAIVDPAGGAQPMVSADGHLVLVYNGEIFNYPELRAELERLGHAFRTASDTEVLLHAFEEWGERMLDRLDGQFAFAIHERRTDTVFLARDRFGVQPLFHAVVGRRLVFGSEIKAILASGLVPAAPDPEGLDEVFTFWAARPPRTPFRGVAALEPGCWARWDGHRLVGRGYFALDYPAEGEAVPGTVEQLDQLLRSAVRLRLRADVPVGGYLSGGLDSSVACALAAREATDSLQTFSIEFEDPRLNEGPFGQRVARRLASRHAVELVAAPAIAEALPQVARHVETPLVRLGPVPIFLLSRLARRHGVKVVFTGEGADELFLGYDLFKEVALRLFCLRQPESARRPRLFQRLYPYLGDTRRAGEFWSRFFLDAGTTGDPLFSHLPRIRVTSTIKEFYSESMRSALAGSDPLERLRMALPLRFSSWSPLNRAAYLEMVTLLSPYLLCSQSDRVNLAHGVEGRYPFLDHRLFKFAAGLPDQQKLLGLRDKRILRALGRELLPEIADRPKLPYRAPDVAAFQGRETPSYARDLLSPAAVRRAGYFDPRAVDGLVQRCAGGRATGVRETQAFVAVLTTQLWHHLFMAAPQVQPLKCAPDIVVRAGDAGPAVAHSSNAGAMTSSLA